MTDARRNTLRILTIVTVLAAVGTLAILPSRPEELSHQLDSVGGTALCSMTSLSVLQSCGCDPATDCCDFSCTSPVILDLTGEGFVLTDASHGVKFDISGTGKLIQIAWTAQGSDNAFLALDRNGNGTIDSGEELFGNFTSQPVSSHRNGFAALAVYDKRENGGNEDGIIDSRDQIFSLLRLWIDANHDGVCQPDELFTLPSKGVNSISLKYHLSQRRDQFGNVFRYRSRVNPDDPSKMDEEVGRTAYDVFLTTKN